MLNVAGVQGEIEGEGWLYLYFATTVRTMRGGTLWEAFNIQSLGRVFKMGGTGDPPVPVGDSPTGMEKGLVFLRQNSRIEAFPRSVRRVAGRYRPVACATHSF